MIRKQLVVVLLLLVAITGGCSDRGIIMSGVHDGERMQDGDLIPFILMQNYPNPFNPSTTVEFTMGSEMFVTLAVYTDNWERVMVAFQGELEPGNYSVGVMLQDQPSGEYFYTLEGGGYTLIRKMRLIE